MRLLDAESTAKRPPAFHVAMVSLLRSERCQNKASKFPFNFVTKSLVFLVELFSELAPVEEQFRALSAIPLDLQVVGGQGLDLDDRDPVNADGAVAVA